MKEHLIMQLPLALSLALSLTLPVSALNYPATRQDNIVESFHGTPVPDPYRWLEDPDSPETQAWVDQQNQLFQGYIADRSERNAILERLQKLYNYPRTGTPRRIGKRFYTYWKNTGLQRHSVLYRQESLSGPAKVLLDPNTLSADGTTAVSSTDFSRDGAWMALGLSDAGSDQKYVRIMNVETGEYLPETLTNMRFASITWAPDHQGFWYNQYPDAGVPKNNKVYYHKLKTAQTADVLVYENPAEPDVGFYPYLTEDGVYLVIGGYKGTDPVNSLYVRKVGESGPFTPLFTAMDASYSVIEHHQGRLLIETDLGAPRNRIVSVDPAQPAPEHWREVVPQQADVLQSAHINGGKLVLSYLHDAHHRLQVRSRNGQLEKEIPLPVPGTVGSLSGDVDHPEVLFGLTSFLFPSSAYRYDLTTHKLDLLRKPEIAFDPQQYESQQIFFTSRDGTRVPMFVTWKKGLKRDGSNPTLLYGYGGFNVSLTPHFNPAMLLWLEQGGVYAVANLRGGGEYGEEWHQAGMLANKQNVFDDFIGAGEALVKEKFTRPDKLAIQGGSNGGLLVAATLLQRPDLFGAAVSQVPVTDMYRYHTFTVGRYWLGEYGNAQENPDHFRFLSAYSPLHTIQPKQQHPKVLVMTADHDDRVVPAHAYKFTAALQAASGSTNPVLLRVETKAGHGAGKPMDKYLQETAEFYTFLFKALEVSWKP
jgi:prolyl oligopeptidase